MFLLTAPEPGQDHMIRRQIVRNGNIVQRYENMSAEDRQAFDRWLSANVFAGMIIMAGLFGMALAGSGLLGQQHATVANNIKAPADPRR